jgi:2-keto-4-pentenoate hydratase/2-oxohepta-3-ene-1,7-dioic acid hydratase in catechol pathway
MSHPSILSEWVERFGNGAPKVVCVGLNYRDHAREADLRIPDVPVLFGLYSSSLCGDGDEILIPEGAGHIDAEAELVVVIGATASRVNEAEALQHVAGYTCGNDVSARDFQFADGQWFRGKALDTFTPIGPRFVARDEVGDPHDLRVIQRVNGEVLQDSSTRELIFSVPYLVSYVSEVLTLEPGDLILTGTPAGVGFFRQPKHSLKPGDVVEVEVEGIGTLQNPVSRRLP